jgi:hypothetical protein
VDDFGGPDELPDEVKYGVQLTQLKLNSKLLAREKEEGSLWFGS